MVKELLKLDAEIRIVDLFTGEHYQEWYTAINPKKKVPGKTTRVNLAKNSKFYLKHCNLMMEQSLLNQPLSLNTFVNSILPIIIPVRKS